MKKIFNRIFGKGKSEDLYYWQDKYINAKAKYGTVLSELSEYHKIYNGTNDVYGADSSIKPRSSKVVRNICYELIEAQIDNNIPTPKVTATKEANVEKAIKIENKLRCELDRLPFETMLDLTERQTPCDGASFFYVEWDNTQRTHDTVGELSVKVLNANQVIPQPGIYNIQDMDYIFVRIATSKEYILKNFGVNVIEENESEPDVKSYEADTADDLVTMITCYYKNENCGIGKFSWVNDVIIEDIDDYQARILRRCASCGAVCYDDECECGCKSFKYQKEDFEYTDEDIILEKPVFDKMGNMVGGKIIPRGSKIPFYKPDIFPIVERKNISKHGSFLGGSDIEVIKHQQDIIKKLETDIYEKLLTGGSIMMLPTDINIEKTDGNFKIVRVDSPAKAEMIQVRTLQPDISRSQNYAEEQYQRARQILGITDSFQGRKDSTATSGTAKQFAAQQTAGRLESKRAMKNASFSDLFEIMAKFLIAFADEPRNIRLEDNNGDSIYSVFTKFDFLERDESGEFYYDVDYLFSTNSSAPLSSNRETMWQETRMNLQQGAFGNPQEPETLLFFWQIMESLHYPNASKMKKQIENKIQTAQQLNELAQQKEALSARNEELYNETIDYKNALNQYSGNSAEGGEGYEQTYNGGQG